MRLHSLVFMIKTTFLLIENVVEFNYKNSLKKKWRVFGEILLPHALDLQCRCFAKKWVSDWYICVILLLKFPLTNNRWLISYRPPPTSNISLTFQWNIPIFNPWLKYLSLFYSNLQTLKTRQESVQMKVLLVSASLNKMLR